MIKKDNIHYCIRRIDSYNKSFNYIISPRVAGKTTAIWTKVYKRFKTDNQPSIVIRRLITDITETYIQDIATCINKFLPDEEQINLEFKKGAIKDGIVDVLVNGDIFLRVIALSNPKSRIKSTILRNPYVIVFDEFICDIMDGEKYLDGEVKKFKEIYTTYSRECDSILKCYFLGNPYSVYNPYFADYDVDLSLIVPGSIITGDIYAIECYKLKPELVEWIRKHNPLVLLEDDYAKYAFGGIATNDENFEIVKKQPEGYKLKHIFRINNKYLGFFINTQKRDTLGYDCGRFWISIIKYEGNNRKIYATDFNNLVKGSRLISTDAKALLARLKFAIARRDVSYKSPEEAHLATQIYSFIK